MNGVVESCNPDDGCNDPEYGEVLVGAGVWTGSQLEVSSVMSIDLSDFGGPVLNGAIEGNNIEFKFWDSSANSEYDVASDFTAGNGIFGDLLSAANLQVVYYGCTDQDACNFDSNANTDDGSCEYPQEYYTCDGNCINDVDGDGVCDELEIAGCTDPDAINYNPEATDDDGSCDYSVIQDIVISPFMLNTYSLNVSLENLSVEIFIIRCSSSCHGK